MMELIEGAGIRGEATVAPRSGSSSSVRTGGAGPICRPHRRPGADRPLARSIRGAVDVSVETTEGSRSLGALVIFVWLRRDPAMRAAWPRRWLGGWSRARFAELLHIGLPASGMLAFESSAFAFSCVMIGWLGTVPLAAHQIAITSASLAFMFPLGLAMATGMRVSHAVGAGELARRRPIALGSAALGMLMMSCFAVAFGFGGRGIAAWFVNDAAVVALAAQLFAVAALFQLFDGLQVIAAASLRGITDVRVPAVITFVAYWLIALPLGYLLGVRGPLGAVGMWTGIATGLAFAAVFLSARFARLTR